ncbi:MAG: hypothetical protein IJ268_13550 [Proteobacteria bacterium]|nr:hypothetical protein [Pseudomonadota bacterium]
MHRKPIIIASFMAVLAMACDGFDVNVSEFETLCLASGGALKTGASGFADDAMYNQCFCGIKQDTPCPQGVVCANGGLRCASSGPRLSDTCQTSQNICTNDESDVAQAGKMMTCKNSLWSYSKECVVDDKPVSCNMSGTACGSCLNDTVVCKDEKTLSRCILGASYDETCTWGCKTVDGVGKCEEKVGDSCDGEETACENVDGGIGMLQICSHGLWSIESCQNASCKGQACGECINGTSVCENDAVIKCENGSWGRPTLCPDGCEASGKYCKTCKSGQYKCINSGTDIGILETCEDGNWIEQPDLNPQQFSCKSTYPDKDISNILGECKNFSTRCWCAQETCSREDPSNILQICNAGRWTRLTSCDTCSDSNGKAVCAQAHGNSECQEFEFRCNNAKRQQCQNDVWTDIETCPAGCDPASAQCNPTCEAGTMRTSIYQMSSLRIETCSDNNWIEVVSCPLKEAATMTCSCTEPVCLPISGNQGILIPCQGNRFLLTPIPCLKGCQSKTECKQ